MGVAFMRSFNEAYEEHHIGPEDDLRIQGVVDHAYTEVNGLCLPSHVDYRRCWPVCRGAAKCNCLLHQNVFVVQYSLSLNQPLCMETDHDQSHRDVPQHPWGPVRP